MSHSENLFIQQNDLVNADSFKKIKSAKKKTAKKKVGKVSQKNYSKISNARFWNYYVKIKKKNFTQLFVQKIFWKIYTILKKKIESNLRNQKSEQCHAVFCSYILRQIKQKIMQKSFFDNEMNNESEK